MAKNAANNKTNGFEQNLWDTANKLRGSVESSEYKHVVLSLIFLKFASDKFEERRAELIAEGKEKYLDMVEFYTMKNVFYLPEKSRWSYINSQAKQDDLAIKIDTVADKKEDVVGRVYEYFLSKFAASEGKGGGEFYTPKDVVNLIAEIARTYHAWRGEAEAGEYEDKAGFCKSAYEQMREGAELDAVIRKNLEVLGYGE